MKLELTAEQAEQFKREGRITIEIPKEKVKLEKVNTINISTIKDNWNREEVIEIIKIINSHSKESVNKWIEENL